ncbi:hypothetical protein GYMLUDRAFT_258509 [Collybiopsis luxurians FD-317 M1]|nr:hypothetical protein GYMLUDRAFT_258509 [Collybiopsis luxurians FD-317 M1]
MATAILAPELLVLWAARQWFAARRLSKCYKGWTKTHAFFALMGGFALYEGNKYVSVLRLIPSEEARQRILQDLQIQEGRVGITRTGTVPFLPPIFSKKARDSYLQSSAQSEESADDLVSTSYTEEEGNNTAIIELEYDANEPDRQSFTAHAKLIGGFSEADIRERGHKDGFCKLIVIIQTTWFVVQLSARWIERLPVTELETMTFAYALLNVLVYFFWWNKPQGVGRPLRIIRKSADNEDMDQSGASTQSKEGRPLLSWNWLRSILSNGREVVRKFLARPYKHQSYQHQSYKDILSNGLRIPLQFLGSLIDSAETIAQKTLGDNPGIGGPTKVRSFERTIELEPDYSLDKLIAYGAGILFGAIHCTAWNQNFPSPVEEVLWKACSVLVTFAPFYLGLVDIITDIKPDDSDTWWMSCLMYVFMAAIICYVIARLSLIILPLLELRDLPPDVFEAVQWTNFLPHI